MNIKQDYQNAIKMIEMDAVTIESGKQLIDYYGSDTNYISLFRSILDQKYSSEIALPLKDYLSKDAYERTIEVLNKLYNRVNTNLDPEKLISVNPSIACSSRLVGIS